MHTLTLYHNPRCSKSREALALLKQQSIPFTIIEYLKTPLDLEQIKLLRAQFDLQDFVRSNEPMFKTLHLSLDQEDAVLDAMVVAPILMQRPILSYGNLAVIGRPIGNILAFIHKIARQ